MRHHLAQSPRLHHKQPIPLQLPRPPAPHTPPSASRAVHPNPWCRHGPHRHRLLWVPEASRHAHAHVVAPARHEITRLPSRVPVPGPQGRSRVKAALREQGVSRHRPIHGQIFQHVLQGVLALWPLLESLPRVLEGEHGKAGQCTLLEVRRDQVRSSAGCEEAGEIPWYPADRGGGEVRCCAGGGEAVQL
uniref:Uncharacterized protein n=1 Tax=Aegilops tauschii subsp. strangulata TaxID=200361 RepID=A0A453AEE9_AEGTS